MTPLPAPLFGQAARRRGADAMTPLRRPTAHLLAALVLVAASGASPAFAHGMRTAYLELVESAPGEALGVWKLPVPTRDAWPVFPEGCTWERPQDFEDGVATRADTPVAGTVTPIAVHCEGPLAGRVVGVDGLGLTVTDAVVRLVLADGTAASHVLGPTQDRWTVPARTSPLGVVTSYITLGARHIAGGPDHLLFVLGLLLLAGAGRRVLWAVTAFTVAHSVTLAATVLGLLRVSPIAGEALIAASLVLVALDIDRPGRDRGAWGLAFVFGLFHGLGFAGALREIGLPDDALGLALLCFNVGVELGQLGFLAVSFAILLLAARFGARALAGSRLVATYGIGTLGLFWFASRAGQLLLQP